MGFFKKFFSKFKKNKVNEKKVHIDEFNNYIKFASNEVNEKLIQMFNEDVQLSDFKAMDVFINELPLLSGDEEEKAISIVFTVNEILPGKMVFVVSEYSAKKIYNLLTNRSKDFLEKEGKLSENSKSCLESVASIFVSSFVSAISNLLNKKILISTPSFSYSFKASIINEIIFDQYKNEDEIFLISSKFVVSSNDIEGLFLFLPEEKEKLNLSYE